MASDREAEELEWHPLSDIASLWLKEAQSAAVINEVENPTFQDLIDALPDHNQTLIDCIEVTSPGLDCALTELMGNETEYAQTAWTSIVNHIFELAQRRFEADDG